MSGIIVIANTPLTFPSKGLNIIATVKNGGYGKKVQCIVIFIPFIVPQNLIK